MSQISVSNPTIRIKLNGNETVTVPSGEVWSIGIHAGDRGDSEAGIRINGTLMQYVEKSTDYNNMETHTVVKAGDTLRSRNLVTSITGHVVRQ